MCNVCIQVCGCIRPCVQRPEEEVGCLPDSLKGALLTESGAGLQAIKPH